MYKTRSKLRGHDTFYKNNDWFYTDTKEPTDGNERACLNCGKQRTIEGHDDCLGTLPGVKNACCGHGDVKYAYIQFEDDSEIRGFADIKSIYEIIKSKINV